MIVIRSRIKREYLEALHQSDITIGNVPSDGAHAIMPQIRKFLRFFSSVVAEELKYNIEFLTETSEKVWWYDGQKIVFRSESTPLLLISMKENPDITIDQLAQMASISVAAVNKQLRQLTKRGYIHRNEKYGSWHVFASQSI